LSRRGLAGTLEEVVRRRCACESGVRRVWWGAVAQLGERLVRNEEVSGSIPLSSTKEDNHLAEKSVASADCGGFLEAPPPCATISV
jgi:hypothetical protein